MYFKGQKFLVAGMSVSGQSSARFLLARGAEVYLYDDVVTDNIRRAVEELLSLGAHEVTPSSYEDAVALCDVLVLSPGIPIDNRLPVTFRRAGKLITCEEQLASRYLRATAIAVTGTNGKTTTVSMIGKMLSDCGKTVEECGNIGRPAIDFVDELNYGDFAVMEISSFQLETISALDPHIAVVTNITEDHLDRHYNMENYVFLKSKLVRSLNEGQYAVLNYDDERVRSFASLTKGKVVWFSAQRRCDGAYVQDGGVWYAGRRVFDIADMSITGVHNVYNALACTAVAGVLGLDMEEAARSICSFKGVRHRIENVGTFGGVTYIDDSKGTNVDATLRAVESMTEPTVLLLGGADKGYEYGRLFESIGQSRVVHTVFYGENRYKILSAAMENSFFAFSLCRTMREAVMLAKNCASAGQCVLLSPASSSFDEFSGYEERGDCFAGIVKGFADD